MWRTRAQLVYLAKHEEGDLDPFKFKVEGSGEREGSEEILTVGMRRNQMLISDRAAARAKGKLTAETMTHLARR